MDRYVDHHSFLVKHGLFTDEMKDSIAMAGHCIVENVADVETIIDFNNSHVTYNLLLPGRLYNNLKLLKRFENGESLGFWNSWKLRSFLKKKRKIEEANKTGMMGYRLDDIANKFLKTYLSDDWSASVEIFNAENKNETANFGVHNSTDK